MWASAGLDPNGGGVGGGGGGGGGGGRWVLRATLQVKRGGSGGRLYRISVEGGVGGGGGAQNPPSPQRTNFTKHNAYVQTIITHTNGST